MQHDKYAEKSGISTGNRKNWRDAQQNWEIFVKTLFRISENALEIVFAF